MNKHPLSVIMENDPELSKAISGAGQMAFANGALAPKYKLLTAMALDVAAGAPNGVKSLAQQALMAGATKEEIFETLRVVYHIHGAGSMYVAAQGLNDIFSEAAQL